MLAQMTHNDTQCNSGLGVVLVGLAFWLCRFLNSENMIWKIIFINFCIFDILCIIISDACCITVKP